MFKNNLKIAVRNLLKNKVISFINITGLAVGMGLCLLMLMYAATEFSYDNYHTNGNRIYRVTAEWGSEGSKMNFAGVMPAVAPALNEEVPEVEFAARIKRNNTLNIKVNEKNEYPEENFYYSDNEILKIFPLSLIEGNVNAALAEPYSVILTKSLSQKYFGDKEPLGKIIQIEDIPFTVTGLLPDTPENTHFQYSALMSYSTLNAEGSYSEFPWSSWGSDLTYVLLKPNASIKECSGKLRQIFERNVPENFAQKMILDFQPLSEIHWDNSLRSDIGPKGNKLYAYIFLIAAILVLLIACFNFMNLSTAKFMDRAREVGVRKVVGAGKFQIILQFLTESVLTASISIIVGIFLYEYFSDTVYSFMGFDSLAYPGQSAFFYIVVIGMLMVVGIAAGSYPALLFSKFKPVKIMRGKLSTGRRKISFRDLSVVLQFTISVVLICSALVIYQQLDYMKNSDLGFDKKNIIFGFMPFNIPNRSEKYEVLKNELLKNQNFTNVSAGYTIPGVNSQFQMSVKLKDADENDNITIQAIPADFDFLNLLKIKLLKGRDFSNKFSTDASEGIILNKTAAAALSLKEPLGKTLMVPFGETYKDMNVIGVIEDFHFKSLHNKIAPAMILIHPDYYSLIAARYKPGSEADVIKYFSEKWESVFPGSKLDYRFVEDQYYQNYSTEEKAGKLIILFTVLALFISCLGLFGLVSYILTTKVKEIGIRKVLGASVYSIVNLISKEFALWIFIAVIIATPAAYYFMNIWLEDFAYRIEINYTVFAAAASMVFGVAFITIIYQSVKSAYANPVDSLRQE